MTVDGIGNQYFQIDSADTFFDDVDQFINNENQPSTTQLNLQAQLNLLQCLNQPNKMAHNQALMTPVQQKPQSQSQEEFEDAHDDDLPQQPAQNRKKLRIELIRERSRRNITFSKRKAGIMKKAHELSVLTGSQVLLLVTSEAGHVYTFATSKFQPIITRQEGKDIIQACLSAPDATEQKRLCE